MYQVIAINERGIIVMDTIQKTLEDAICKRDLIKIRFPFYKTEVIDLSKEEKRIGGILNEAFMH